ncbi:ErfK/YbiS/YcfS/YnhG family protein [Hyphomicrobium denitrificans 1NES1]|uniref:ErfK/YbiS/YcfS/YnhG family protein n=1 Tax=Hyphomicrobium denitrificans 1NES1 TaxID=670307 RepID=N0B8X4_9HYPH|nr:murein L,D-transpeptidase family protein [Hyphomicrobium denitrificans]AGK59483.1 ErfK/YbiS/YcfS/YnhG family protein [Hyphomicrobium denitrificans 1NES1]
MHSGTQNQRAPSRPRRRWLRAFFLTLIAVGIAGVAAFELSQVWMPRVFGDDGLIRYERIQRRLRADFGLPMPGQPDLAHLSERLADSGLKQGAPVLVRIFKRDFELELWMQRDGKFHRFATYPICRWSGWLGPKLIEGDRQAPEGFYTVDASALNPNSRWFRSFNLGYPNAFDRSQGRTGSLIMVHGGCGSIGCFAMTNRQMAEIWQLVTAALENGQKRFQVQVYPFRMSDAEIAEHAQDPDAAFWRKLKAGNDLFEGSSVPPKVSVCNGRYRFEAGATGTGDSDPVDVRCSNN